MHPAKPFAAAVTGSTMESVTGHSPQPDPLRPDPLRPDAARPEPPTTDPQRHDVRRHDPQSGRFRAPEVDDFRPIPGDQGPGGPPATDPLQSGTQAGGPGPTTAGGGFTGRPGALSLWIERTVMVVVTAAFTVGAAQIATRLIELAAGR